MIVFIIIGVLAILAFTAYKSLTCSRASETVACNIWRLVHILSALGALWQVRNKFRARPASDAGSKSKLAYFWRRTPSPTAAMSPSPTAAPPAPAPASTAPGPTPK